MLSVDACAGRVPLKPALRGTGNVPRPTRRNETEKESLLRVDASGAPGAFSVKRGASRPGQSGRKSAEANFYYSFSESFRDYPRPIGRDYRRRLSFITPEERVGRRGPVEKHFPPASKDLSGK